MNLLNRFTIRNLIKNKKRTIVTIIGVVLSSSLMFTVGLFFSTIRENSIRDAVKNNGKQHVIFSGISSNKLSVFNKKYITDVKKVGVIASFEDNYDDIDMSMTSYLNATNNYEDFVIDGQEPNKNEIIISKNYSENKKKYINDYLNIEDIEYKIVGIYSKNIDSYSYSSNTFLYTNYFYTSLENVSNYDIYITFNNPRLAYSYIDDLGKELKLESSLDRTGNLIYSGVHINSQLLLLYGGMGNAGTYAILILSLMLILTILGIVCFVVIFNAFSISVNERKRMFGMFSSIGASANQILKSVLFEAFIISLIAIPLGFLLSLGLIQLVVFIINTILKGVSEPYVYAFYPLFVFIPLLFLIATIFLSSFIPAKRASETTPMNAIRMNDDVRLRSKKVKTNKLIEKVFGVECNIALKNIKRNKKKYRVTVVSIVTSIVLFLTFGTYINFIMNQLDSDEYISDIYMYVNESKNQKKIINDFINIKGVKNYLIMYQQYISIKELNEKDYNEYYYKYYVKNNNFGFNQRLNVIKLEDNVYNKYKKKLGLEKDVPIIYNVKEEGNININNITIGVDKTKVFNDNLNLSLCNYKKDLPQEIEDCYMEINNIYLTDVLPDEFRERYNVFMIVNSSLYGEIYSLRNDIENANASRASISIDVDGYKSVDDDFKKVLKDYSEEVSYTNVKMMNYNNEMILLSYKFIIYSIVIFISFISITSLINTVNTNISLRRREFAILRSIGMDNNKFNKMIFLESIFLSIKSIIYGLIISIAIIYLIGKIFNLSYGNEKIILEIPLNYIFICIVSVVVINMLTMLYSISKIKKKNIIDEIKEENI